MGYYSCEYLAQMFLTVGGRIDVPGSRVALCCENFDDIPKVPFTGAPEEDLHNFINKWKAVISESKKYGTNPPPESSITGCSKCPLYCEADWAPDGLIHSISLGVYPSPCQCHCIYCHVYDDKEWMIPNENTAKAYEQLIAMLEYGKKSKAIAPDAIWQMTCGEISIHPYKKRFLDLVHGQATMFFSNCFKYDEDIAQNLHDNANSQIFLSIDSGTPETWRKIKGVDNFEDVMDNIVKYYNKSIAEGQIRLKYIVLPGINDTWEDYTSLVKIAKLLKVSIVEISRDFGNPGEMKKVSISPEERTTLVSAAAYLLALCRKHGVPTGVFEYTPDERMQMEKFAQELLVRGL